MKDRMECMTGPTRGIIYYNSGTKCLLRMFVSLVSLRKVYNGNVVIFYFSRDVIDTPEAVEHCKAIAERFNCTTQEIDLNVPKGKNQVFLERTKYCEVTPFDVSLSLDSDTIVQLHKISHYFDAAEENEFSIAQFADWKTYGGLIAKRIKYWDIHHKHLVERALEFGPAINCGCFAFRKDSKIMRDWYSHAVVGRDSFIADETCMQLLLPIFRHKIMPSVYNYSCKYEKNPVKDAIMIHYHGKKHCRCDQLGTPLYNANQWLNHYMMHCNKSETFKLQSTDRMYQKYNDEIHRYMLCL